MFKIGDFSRLCRIPVSALRYYADIGLLEPAQIDTFTGYRYYTLDQIQRLNRILALKDLGLSLDQIRAMLNEALSPEELRGMLKLKQAEIEQTLADERARLARVAARLSQIEQEGPMTTIDVVLKPIEAQHVLTIRAVLPKPDDVGGLMGQSFGALMGQGVAVVGPPMALFHDGEFKTQDLDVEIAFPVGPAVKADIALGDGRNLKAGDLPELPEAACVVHNGAYDMMEPTYTALGQWIAASGYQIAGPVREVYLTAPGDPAGTLTEIQYPVTRA